MKTPIVLDLPAALRDAQCDEMLANRILALDDSHDIAEEIRLLRVQRSAMLNRMHEARRAVDCIDFLIHALE